MTMWCVASAFNGACTAIIPQVTHWMNDAPEVQGGVSACQFGCSWWWAHLLDVLRWRNWVQGLHLCWFKTTDKSHAAGHSILTPRFEEKRIQWFSSQHLILLLWRKDWRIDREHGVLVYIALRVLVRIQHTYSIHFMMCSPWECLWSRERLSTFPIMKWMGLNKGLADEFGSNIIIIYYILHIYFILMSLSGKPDSEIEHGVSTTDGDHIISSRCSTTDSWG